VRTARRRLTVDERRTKLLAVGVEMFSTRPYHEVGVEELAAAAGVSNGLLYHYYRGKREFYIAVVEEAYSRLIRAISEGTGSLTEGLDKFLHYIADNSAEWTWLIRVAGSEGDLVRVAGAAERVFVDQIVDLVGSGDDSPTLLNAVTGWVGYNENAGRAWLQRHRRPGREQMVELMSHALMGALRGVSLVEPGALRPEIAAALRAGASSPALLTELSSR
jgi:AcrR family transcriptional regulator